MLKIKIEKRITEGLNFLDKSQEKDGGFLSLSSVDRKKFSKSEKYKTTFSASLLLSCLNEVSVFPEKTERIKKKMVNFLLFQKSEDWTFNYWDRKSKEFKNMPYPEDLDDSFCSLAALFKYNEKLIDSQALAKIVNVLAFCEKETGGPYFSWIVGKDAEKHWKDVDLAVNSNIAYFLSLQGVFLENINKLVEKAILKKQYSSPYYYSDYPVIYFISRFYDGKKKEEIIKYLLKKRNKEFFWKNTQNTALAVCSLLNLGYFSPDIEKSIQYLVGNKNKQIVFPFVIEKIKKKKIVYSGSQELNVAFCLEALSKYSKKAGISERKKKNLKKENEQEKIICNKVIEKFEAIGKRCLGENPQEILKKDNKNQVILLPYLFVNSLKERKKIDQKMIIQLGLANLLGWVAYTIYDDFLDNEGDALKMPLANLCLRELTNIFLKILPENEGFYSCFQKTMDEIEKANLWEIQNCRIKISSGKIKISSSFPDYGNYEFLAMRSMGHALGPIAIIFSLEKKQNSLEIKKLKIFFQNYIIARQLSDDIHDWKDDLKKGQLSAVVVSLLKTFSQRKKKKTVNLEKDRKYLEEIFWCETVSDFCYDILKSVKKARKAIEKVAFFKNNKLLESLINPLENMAKETLEEQKEVLDFLSAYSQKK